MKRLSMADLFFAWEIKEIYALGINPYLVCWNHIKTIRNYYLDGICIWSLNKGLYLYNRKKGQWQLLYKNIHLLFILKSWQNWWYERESQKCQDLHQVDIHLQRALLLCSASTRLAQGWLKTLKSSFLLCVSFTRLVYGWLKIMNYLCPPLFWDHTCFWH